MNEKIINILKKETKLTKKEISNLIEIPPDQSLGDYAFPCFILSKKLKKNPNEIASQFVKKVKVSKEIEKIEAKGPYINFFINSKALAKSTLSIIQKQKEKYGSSKKQNSKIMIEFSQPNTHKAFHIGHVRGTSLGESISRIAESQGNEVLRANYSGDTGMHIAKWLWYYNKSKNKKPKNEESWFAKIYVEAIKKLALNEDFQSEVDDINKKLEERSDKNLNKLWKQTRGLSIKSWNAIYKELDTKFNVHYYESQLEKRGKELANKLFKNRIAEISDGATIINLEKYNLGVWVLLRKDGTVLYSAKDLALAEKKFNDFKIDKSIILSANEQDLHFKQLIKVLELMNFRYARKYGHLSYNVVRLPTGKMSSRTGENILYSDFKNELIRELNMEIKKRTKISEKVANQRASILAIASLKYTMLKQDTNKAIIFDKNEALRFEGNTGPYILYTYARARSILKKANQSKSKLIINNVSLKQKQLIMQLSNFPKAVQQAYNSLAPNVIANYVYQLAQIFNEFYHSEKVIGSENEKFKLTIVEATAQILKNSLSLLGIQTLEKM
jgi:arginyl-tRNA synthetase